jgi:SAM-dependent methyltransferase
VLSNSVLEHIPNLDPVLEEAARVLRPGGRLILTVPSDAFRRLLGGYQARRERGDLAGAEAYAAGVDGWLAHQRYPTPEEWAGMLEKVGLKLVHTAYYVAPEVMALWDRANTTYGVRAQKPALYRFLASPRLRRLGYQRWVRRWIVRTLRTRWRHAYEMDVPQGQVGGGLLVVGERIG